MKKALAIDPSFIEYPYYQRFAMAKEAGFSYVALDGWTELDFSRINVMRQNLGLGIAAISGSRGYALTDPESHESFLEHLSQSIAVCRCFGCANLILTYAPGGGVSGSPNPPDTRTYTRMSLATSALMDAATSAAKAGMTLLLKPSGGPDQPVSARIVHSAAGVVRSLASPALRLYCDIGQMRVLEGSVSGSIRNYRDAIGYVHISESPDGYSGEDLAALQTVLEQDIGYHGFVGFAIAAGKTDRCWLDAVRRL